MGTREDKLLGKLNEPVVVETGSMGIAFADPAIIDGQPSSADGGDSGTAKRKRGRPSGAKSSSGNNRSGGASTGKNQAKNSGTIGIEQILFSIHMMMAGAIKVPELSLTQDESKQLANAIAEVNSHYNIAIDPKVMAWIGLSTTCVSIYAPRIAAYKIREGFEKKQRKAGEKTIQTPQGQKVDGPQKGLQPDSEILPMSVGIPA